MRLCKVNAESPIPAARVEKILPQNQADLARPVLPEKINLFSRPPNHLYIRSRLVPLEGRIAIVTDAGWDAVDAAVPAHGFIAGRVSRERSDCAQTNGAGADGEVVWS